MLFSRFHLDASCNRWMMVTIPDFVILSSHRLLRIFDNMYGTFLSTEEAAIDRSLQCACEKIRQMILKFSSSARFSALSFAPSHVRRLRAILSSSPFSALFCAPSPILRRSSRRRHDKKQTHQTGAVRREIR